MNKAPNVLIILLVLALAATWVFHLASKEARAENTQKPVVVEVKDTVLVITNSQPTCDSILIRTKDSLLQIEKELRFKIDSINMGSSQL